MNKIGELFTKAARETKAGRFDKAISVYEKIIKLSEQRDEATHLSYWGIGEIYLNTKRYQLAEENLKKAVELGPDEDYYNYLLGCTYRYLERIDESIHYLEKAVQLNPKQDIFWCELGWVYGHNKDNEKGIKYLKKAHSINPENSNTLRDLCMLFTKEQRFKEALVCIEEAENHNPADENIQRIKHDVDFFRKEFERFNKVEN